MSAPGDRVDRWLWNVRLFRSRPLAAEACDGGHVARSGQRLKPSSTVRPGDLLQVRNAAGAWSVRVLGCPPRRLPPAAVPAHREDLERPEPPAPEGPRDPELAALLGVGDLPPVVTPARDRGTGRPTKRDARRLRALHEDDAADA